MMLDTMKGKATRMAKLFIVNRVCCGVLLVEGELGRRTVWNLCRRDEHTYEVSGKL